jgi:uncharacterized repeat protein (TIGR01451 family)
MARSAKYGLVLSLVCYCLATCLPVLAQPVPHVTLDVPADVLIGEDFTFTVTFDNANGTMGYGPFIDLVLQFGGIDKNDPLPSGSPGPCDGITILSAEMVGGGPIPFVLSPSPCTAADCQNSPFSGPLTHPAPQVDGWGVGTNGAQAAPIDITGLKGAQLWMLIPLIGSYDSSQPPIVVKVTAHVHEYADADKPLVIRARGGFLYGSTPQDDYLQGDLPILSDDEDSASWNEYKFVTPRAFTLKKEYLGPEHEAVSGPNFVSNYNYPLRFQITVDVADGQEIDKLHIIDVLPTGMVYHPLSLQVWLSGAQAALYSASACLTPQPGTAAVVEPTPSGGTLEVTVCDLITGHQGLPYEVVIFFDFYIEDIVGAGCEPVRLVNDVSATGVSFPLDPRDQSGLVTSDSVEDWVDAKCMAIQKSVVLYDDPLSDGLTPGDTLKYTLAFQISDYRTIGQIEIHDKLSDGQMLSTDPSLVPMLTIQDQFGSYPVYFSGLTATENPSSNCDCCCCTAVGFVRGVADLVFDVSGALVAADAASLPLVPRHQAGILTGGHAALPTSTTPAVGQVTFYVTITDEFFVTAQAPGDKYVDKDDPINNCVTIDGVVYDNKDQANDVPDQVTGSAEDISSTCVALAPGVLSKEVYAVKRGINYICGPGGCGIPDVLPGDDVTFRIQYTIPSGDAEKLTIQDWLPVPVFDVDDPTNTNGAQLSFLSSPCPGGSQPPATGLVACGPTHSPVAPPPLATFFPQPTLLPVTAGNSFTFRYDSPWDTLNTAKTIDLLFTLTVTNEPFADGLYLTNETQECELNTFGVQFCQTAIAQVHVREPKLSIQKGVIATSNPSGVFTINNGPAPLTSGLPIATPPSASCACFTPTPPITSGSSLAGFIGRDLRNINAGDWVTFAIVVENTGGAPAYEIEVKDTFPLGSDGNPSCFYPVFPVSSSLPCVTDGYGSTVPFTFTLSSDHFVIELLQPLDPLNSVTQATGTNIAIITFPATAAYKPHLQSDCCPNTATLIRYTSAADIVGPPLVLQPNFVGAQIGGPFEDTALICVGPTAYSKCIEATSEPNTVPDTAGSMSSVPTPNAFNTVDAAIGEIIRFRLITVIPEGTTPGLQITDLLPQGLTYIGNPRVSFVANSGIGTSPYESWTVISGDETTHGSCPGPVIAPPGTALAVCCGTAPFAFGSGQDPTFFVESSTLPAPHYGFHNLDHDANLELVIIEFNAQVDNILGNHYGTTLANSFQVTYQDGFTNSTIPSLSDPVFVRVVEPALALSKTASVASIPGANKVTYTVTIAHDSSTSSSDALDIQLHDTLPTGLTYVNGSLTVTGSPYNANCSGSNIEVTDLQLEWALGQPLTITYEAAAPVLACDRTFTNTATVTWTSLPGTNGTLANPTGQSTVDDPLELNDGERNGSDGLLGSGILNDYQVQRSATITVPGLPDIPSVCAYPLPNGICAWWPLDETSGATVQDIAGGFDGTPMPGSIGGSSGNGPVTSVTPLWSVWTGFPVGQVDNSLFFDGVRHIEVPDAPCLDPGVGPFTVDAWVIYKHAFPNTPECTIVKKGNSGAGWRFVILPASDLLQFEVLGGSWPPVQASIAPDSWHHVAATVARGALTATITLYVDGIAASTTTLNIVSSVSIDSPQSLFIGGDGVAAGAIAVDEVEIFHETLQLTDIEALFFACHSGKCKPDLGDAPDSSNHDNVSMLAYPGVLAHFPTVYDPNLLGPLGPMHRTDKGSPYGLWLGADVSLEGEADTGWDQDMSTWGNNIQPILQISNRDVDDGVTSVPLPYCAMTSLTFSVTSVYSVGSRPGYINVWFDWNRDGDWDDDVPCPGTSYVAPEWAVQNHVVTLNPGLNSALVTPTFRSITPPPGQTIWMRITLTSLPVSASNSDGSGPVGGYQYGETEDYELGPY